MKEGTEENMPRKKPRQTWYAIRMPGYPLCQSSVCIVSDQGYACNRKVNIDAV